MSNNGYETLAAGAGFTEDSPTTETTAVAKTGMKVMWKVITVAGIVAAIILILYLIIQYAFPASPGIGAAIDKAMETKDIQTAVLNLKNTRNTFTKYIGAAIFYLFRFALGINLSQELKDSAIIILISSWAIFFLVMKDLFSLFSMNPKSAPLIAFFLALIMANIGVFTLIFNGLMQVFAFLASLSVIAVLASIIFFGFAAHWGISDFGMLMMKRRAMLRAGKIEAESEQLAATVEGLLKTGDAFARHK